MFANPFKKQQTGNSFKQKTNKVLSPAKRWTIMVLIALGLNVVAPDPLVAANATQQNTPITYSQLKQQSAYSQMQLEEGSKRVNETIEALKKENEKEPEKASYNNHIISILENLDPNEMGKFCKEVFFKTYQFDDIALTVVNNEVEYYLKDYTDLTEEFKRGEENFNKKINENFDSKKEDGTLKTEREHILGGIVGATLEDYLVGGELLAMLDSKPAADTLPYDVSPKSTLEMVDNNLDTLEEAKYKIRRNLDAMTNASEACNVIVFDLSNKLRVDLNEEVLLAVENNNGKLIDITAKEQASLNHTL